MSDLVSFQLYDDVFELPLTTATPTFVDYRDRTGAALPQPAITHVANGVYTFTPSVGDIADGVVWVISSGAGAIPARYSGASYDPGLPFQVCVFEDGTGALVDISATPPTLAFYKTRAGVDIIPAPTPVNVSGGYLWTITPAPADSITGCVFDVVAPAGALPLHYAGDLLSISGGGSVDILPPVISNIIPAPSTPIYPRTPLGFDVTDNNPPLRLIMIKAEFVATSTWDLIHDGTVFGPLYQGASNTRTAIAGGYRYTILRDTGWTVGVPPIITPYAVDLFGNENP